jgi:hypothetical protein
LKQTNTDVVRDLKRRALSRGANCWYNWSD